MIKSIHITRDQFAAENHGAEGTFIDIITQPGVGPVRTNLVYNAHNSAMAARNPLASTKGSDTVQNYGLNLSGGLIQNKASFAVGVRGNSTLEPQVLTAFLPTGVPAGARSQTLLVRSPRDSTSLNGNFDYAITRDQTLRISYNQNDVVNKNQGVGGFNLPERARA
jgi:hypothetical protein